MFENDGNYIVYVYFRPNGIPCYVGKGRPRRARHHKYVTHNERLARLLKKNGGLLPFVIIRDSLTNEESSAIERVFIKVIGRADLGEGPLFNLTDGGDGSPGSIKTIKSRNQTSNTLRGRCHTDETRLKMSLAKRPPRTREAIEKGAAKRRGIKTGPLSIEHRNKLSAAAKKRPPRSLESLTRLSESLKRAWAEGRHNGLTGVSPWNKNTKGQTPSIWVNNGVRNKRIFPWLQIPPGWQVGRLFSDDAIKRLTKAGKRQATLARLKFLREDADA